MVIGTEHGHTAEVAVNTLRYVPLVPLIGSLVHMLVGYRLGRAATGVIACLGPLISFAIVLTAVMTLGGSGHGAVLVDNIYTWMSAGELTIDAAFSMDALTAVMCLVITGVGSLIHIYSTGYMSHDEDYARFFAYLNLFTASMLVLVLGDSLPLMFVGWEGVGLCSYLLIGFWYEDPAKASAGKKAFVVNRVGDAGFLLGMFVLFWATAELGHASLRFADINAAASSLPAGVALAATALLFVGATGKSAQIPLFVWLPDAMAGPTPVSALIHAATMVTAGIYMVARLSPLYLEAPTTLNVVAVIGALTALGAATVGLVQNDIKKVLAYSTVSQLGYMFLALGVGAFGAALFHVVTHAFFKALLFLGAGSVIHALHEEQDIRNMGGLKEKMPITFYTWLAGWLAIIGFPLFSGFFSKDEILASTFDAGHPILWGIGVVGAACTAFYMTRLTVLTFFGEYRGSKEKWDHAHESPINMTFALMVLAVLSVFAGLMGVPPVLGGANQFAHYLEPVLGHHELHISHATELALMGVSVSIVLLSAAIAWRRYSDGPKPDETFSQNNEGIHTTLTNAYYIDEAYDRGIVGGVGAFSRMLWKLIDVAIIDGIANGVGTGAQAFAGSWRRWSTGNISHYALSVLLGVAVLVAAVAAAAAR